MPITYMEDVISGRQQSHLYKFENWEQETEWFSTPIFFSTLFQRYRNFSIAVFLEWCRVICKYFPICSKNRARFKKIYIFAIPSTAFAHLFRVDLHLQNADIQNSAATPLRGIAAFFISTRFHFFFHCRSPPLISICRQPKRNWRIHNESYQSAGLLSLLSK